MSQVAILGVGTAGSEEGVSNNSINELVFAASSRALAQAGVKRSRIDSVVLAAHDVDDGRGITSMTVAGAAGAYMKDEVRVAESGTFGVATAASRLMAGHYSLSLVVSWGKASESNQDIITQLGFEPFFDRPIAQNEKVALALQAGRYRSASDSADIDETAARWVEARRAAAPGRRTTSADAPSMVCTPLTNRSIADDNDGACAVVLARSDASAVADGDPLWLLGSGWASDSYYLGTRGFGTFPSLRESARTVLRRGNVSAASSIDIVELDSPTPFHEMMAAESLGLCPAGEGANFVRDNLAGGVGPTMGGRGGAFGWKPMAASGLARFIDVVESMRTSNAELGMAHGSSGNAWQSHCVCLVGKSPRQEEN
jgi:acetyl-CoA acetyltransferase